MNFGEKRAILHSHAFSDAFGPGSSPGGHTKDESPRFGVDFRLSPAEQGEKPKGAENRGAIFFSEAKPRRTHQNLI